MRPSPTLVLAVVVLGACGGSALETTGGGGSGNLGTGGANAGGGTGNPSGGNAGTSSDGGNGGGGANVGGAVGNGGNGTAGSGAVGAGGGTNSSCKLAATYSFYFDGGLRAYADTATLMPPGTLQVSRMNFVPQGSTWSCSAELPCISSGDGIGVDKIAAAVAQSDVQAALTQSMPPHYGNDPRPVDGSIWVFRRNDGRGFSIGGSGAIPSGLLALEALLDRVQAATLASPACAGHTP